MHVQALGLRRRGDLQAEIELIGRSAELVPQARRAGLAPPASGDGDDAPLASRSETSLAVLTEAPRPSTPAAAIDGTRWRDRRGAAECGGSSAAPRPAPRRRPGPGRPSVLEPCRDLVRSEQKLQPGHAFAPPDSLRAKLEEMLQDQAKLVAGSDRSIEIDARRRARGRRSCLRSFPRISRVAAQSSFLRSKRRRSLRFSPKSLTRFNRSFASVIWSSGIL